MGAFLLLKTIKISTVVWPGVVSTHAITMAYFGTIAFVLKIIA